MGRGLTGATVVGVAHYSQAIFGRHAVGFSPLIPSGGIPAWFSWEGSYLSLIHALNVWS